MHLRSPKRLPPPPPQTLMALPDGPAGIKETLRIMGRLVKQGKVNPFVRQKATSLTQHLKQKDRLGELNALFQFVRDRIRYVRDINGVETLHEPQQVLLQRHGDCDDKAVLLASLAESIGIPTKFEALAFKPGVFSHVIVRARPYGKWVPLETTHPVKLGWYPRGVVAVMPHHNSR